MEKFRTFEFFSALNAARKRRKSLSLLLPVLFAHMLLICIREKFFCHRTKSSLRRMLPDCRIVDPPEKFADWREKNSSPEFFHRHWQTVRSLYPQGRILACKVLASCFSTTPVANVHIRCQKVPKQNFPKMPCAPNSTLGLIFGLNINWHETKTSFLSRSKNLVINVSGKFLFSKQKDMDRLKDIPVSWRMLQTGRRSMEAKFVHFEFLIHSNNIQVKNTCHPLKVVRTD